MANVSKEFEQTKLALKLREEAQEMVEDSKSDGSLSRFWEGLKAGATDADLWTGGLSSVADGFLIRDVMEKYNADKENLTKEEDMLLEAFFAKLSIEAYTDLGIAYNVGKSVPESIGFMLSFLASPTNGAARGLTRKFTKWAIKKYGTQYLRNNAIKYALGKGTAFGAGATLNALVTSTTTGAGHTARNISDNLTKSYDPNEDKFVGDKKPLTAIAEGLFETFNEVFVEEAGGSLLKSIFKPIDWGLGKISPTYTQAKGLWDNFAGGQGFKKFKNLTGFHGTPIEFGEEILTDIANMPVTDDTFDTDEKTGIFGARRMVTTALSCLAIGAIMNAQNVAKYKSESKRVAKYRENTNNLGSLVLGKKWEGIKSRIDNATPSEIEGVVMQEMMKGKLTTSQKKAILKYAGARVQQDALLLRENELAMEAKASKVIDAQGTLNDKTNEGYNATDENEQRRMAILALQSEQEVKAMLGGNEPEEMSALNTRYGVTTAEDLVAKVVNDESLTPEQRNAILNYINTDASKHAIEKRMADDANAQIMQAKREIDSYANEDAVQARNPNNVITAKLKEDDSQVYIISGEMKKLEDGTVDTKGSSESIVVFNPNAEDPTKQKVMTTPAQLYDVTKGNAQAMLDERVSQIKAEHQRKLTQVTTGERTFEINQQITIPTQDGQGVQTATITNITPGKNGSPLITYTSDVDGTTSQVTIPKAEVEQKMDEVLLIGNTPSASETPSAITAEPQISVPQVPVVEVEETKPIEVEDNVTFEVDGNQLQGVVASIEEGDGVAIVQTEDEKVHRVPLDNLTIVEETATKEQGGNNVEPTAETTSEGSSQEILDNSNEEEQNAPIAPTESTPQAETPSESAPQGANDSKLPPLMGIPTDENGNKMYESASVEATINDIYNDPELDEEEADAYVQARIDGATQRIADLEDKKPKMGESKEAYIAERATWREELEAQQASLDYWNGVQAQRAKAKSSEADDVIDEPNVPMMSAEESDEGNKLSQEEAQENAELDSLRKKTPGLKQEVKSAEAEAEAHKGLIEVYLRKDAEGKKKAKDDLLTALQGNTSLESVGATLSNIRGRKRRIGWRKRQTSGEARAEYRALKFLEKAYESRSRELHAMDRFSKALGVTVQVVDQVDGGKANAKIVGNKVLIAKDAQQGIKEALSHELLHRIKALSPEAYEAFAQAIEKVFANPIELANGRKTLTFEQMMVNMRMRYSSHRMDISIEGVREEVVADLAGMIMTDAELMERFVEETEGKKWYWQIWDTIKELLKVAKNVFRGQDHRNFVNAEKVLLEAMQMASEVQLSAQADSTTTSADKGSDNIGDVQEDAKYSLRSDSPFYSNAEFAVENIKQGKATPEQWLAMIQKNGGLKAGEDKWLGLSDWLKDSKAKSLTKDEVLEFIKANQIVVEEVRYSQFGEGFIDEATRKLDAELKEVGWEEMENRYPGFEEYFEMYGNELVWSEERASIGEYEDFILDNFILTPNAKDNAINETREKYTTDFLENKKEIALVVPSIEPYRVDDEIHFGDAGGGRAVAWVRFGETTDADGNRVLVIDEIQSKRHQDGREKGYRDAEMDKRAEEARKAYIEADKAFNQFREQLMEKYNYSSLVQGTAEERREGRKIWRSKFTPEEMTKYDQLHNNVIDTLAAHDNLPRQINRVPDAPFDKNWHELAMKRMLRYAAENGFDKVAWTTGAQQAERYDIGSVVKAIRKGRENDIIVIDLKNGEYIPLVVDKNGLVISGKYQGEKLSNIIGKELAEKAMNLPIGERLADVDLHIGGEGMKGFYDKMLPSFMNKYGKKWGVKVGEVTMPNIGDSGLTMHSIDVTDAMKESVMEGQPLFRDGSGALSDADLSYANDPFAKALGKSQRTKAQQAKFAERERKYMRNRVAELVEKLGIGERVELIEGGEFDNERKAKAKGWYDAKSDKIVINLANHTSVADIERTLLHEAVSHHGLRELFGKQFNTFLDNVFRSADHNIRTQIVDLATRNGWDFRTATEEYLAQLAEDTNFDALENNWSFWSKIKQLFMDMLESIGWNYQGPTLTDNELRYLLWRSYENMVNPGRHRSILGMAEDVVKREKFGIGTYSTDENIESQVAEGEDVKYSLRDNQGNPIDENGRLIVEEVSSIDEITDADFETPSRNVQLPPLPKNVDEAIVANGKPVVIKKNVFEKNAIRHKFNNEQSRNILKGALYNPNLVGQTQPTKRPKHWVAIKLDERSPITIIEVNENKDNIEVVGWFTLDDKNLERLKRQADNEGGELLILSSTDKVDSLSTPINNLSSADKVNNNLGENQEDDTKYSLRSDDGLSNPDKVIARETYERMVASGRYQFTEAMQDSMMGLKLLYKAILGKKMQVENIPDFENAYIAENLMSSQNAAMQQEYYIKYMKPLTKAIHALGGKDKAKRQAIIDYLMAKHGLERNQVMAQRDAKAVADEAVKDITEEEKKNDKWQQAYNEAFAENREKDYAGLTALTKTDKVAEAEAKATEMVKQFEADNNKDNAVTELWARVNDATKANLERLRKGGVISTQQYRDTLEMYEYYIPLRGWDATTSDEVYAYLISKNTGMMGSTMKMSKGRESKADDPIATIGAMADSAIREANRNAMKQRFLNFVFNHPSDLVSVDSIWLQYDDVTNTWIPVFADIKAEDTPDVVEQKIQEFNEKMEQLRRENPGKYKHGKEAQNIPYVVKPGMEKEHQVMVKRNGQTYILTINGNPRAAQALNGLTNPDVDVEGWIGKLLNGAEKVNRQLSAFYTTRNPDFVVSNFSRDMIYANTMVWVKESPKYAGNFHANVGIAFSMLPKLLVKWERGTLDMNNSLEEMFYQFMINGGETGYTEIRDVEKHKRMIASELKKHKNVVINKWHGLGAVFDGINRWIENVARFAAFKTSREMGRTVQRSAYDAKEISVNFNKKGSGAKMLGATGQTFWGDFGAWNSGLGRTWWVFWNAGVQGATNFGKNVKRHPVKATALMSLAFVLGACAPTWNDDDDEDKKKYYLIPEYIRRSNICFRVWGDTWCTIPLPIELRAMYGLGELYTAVTSGGEKLSNEELAYAIAGQVSQVLPLDMLEGGGGLNALIPTAIKPIVEAYRNIGWHGGPIHREFYTSDMADTTPQWTLAYPSVSSFLMNFTKALNEWSGGENYEGVEGAKPNDAIKGEIDLNPAKIEYVLKGYFGGVYTTFNNIIKSTETVFGDRKFEAKNTPVYNRIFKEDDPEAEKRKYNKIFYKDKEADAIMEKRIKNAIKFSKGSLEYADKLAQLQKSDEYKSYVYRKGYKEAVKLIQKRLNYGDELINEEDLNARIDALKKEMAEGMESADNKSVKKLEIESAKRALKIDKDFKDVDAKQNEIKGKKRAEELKEQGASATKIKRSKGYYEGYKKRQTKEFDEREAEIRRMENEPEDLFDEDDYEEQGD